MADNDELHGLRPVPTSLGLGERLRSARKARALTAAQVAESLRLEEASVIALEEGRFDAMGAPVFVRGHLKRYAALVGLSADSVLEAYRAAAPGSDAPPMIARPRPTTGTTLPLGNWGWWLLAAIVVIGLMLAFSAGDDEPAGITEPATLEPFAAPAPADTAAPAATDAPPPTPTPPPANVPAPAPAPAPEAGPAPAPTGN